MRNSLVILSLLALAACKNDDAGTTNPEPEPGGEFDQAGQEMEEAVDQTGDAFEETAQEGADELGEGADEAEDALE